MKDPILSVLSFGGAVFGSMMIASNTAYSKYAYFGYLTSSVASIILLRKSTDVNRTIELQCWFFLLTNVIGLVRWFHLLG